MGSIDVSIVGWRAWYTQGRKYDSSTTKWEDLPDDGALVFVLYQKSRPHRRMMLGVSLYWHIGDVYACDNAADALIPEGASVKRGKWTTDPEQKQVLDEANQAWEAPDEGQRV